MLVQTSKIRPRFLIVQESLKTVSKKSMMLRHRHQSVKDVNSSNKAVYSP